VASLLTSKLHHFLRTTVNLLETQVFARAGRNEVGGAFRQDQTEESEKQFSDTSRDIGIPKSRYARSNCWASFCVGSQNEVAKIYYETSLLSIEKEPSKILGNPVGSRGQGSRLMGIKFNLLTPGFHPKELHQQLNDRQSELDLAATVARPHFFS